MLNSGYEMPINGLGTYSLHGDECRDSVRTALENGVRLIDTASAYGNEEEIGQMCIRDSTIHNPASETGYSGRKQRLLSPLVLISLSKAIA